MFPPIIILHIFSVFHFEYRVAQQICQNLLWAMTMRCGIFAFIYKVYISLKITDVFYFDLNLVINLEQRLISPTRSRKLFLLLPLALPNPVPNSRLNAYTTTASFSSATLYCRASQTLPLPTNSSSSSSSTTTLHFCTGSLCRTTVTLCLCYLCRCFI